MLFALFMILRNLIYVLLAVCTILKHLHTHEKSVHCTDTTYEKSIIDYNSRILIPIETMSKPGNEFNSQNFLFNLFNASGNCVDLEVVILCPNGYRFLQVSRIMEDGEEWVCSFVLRKLLSASLQQPSCWNISG